MKPLRVAGWTAAVLVLGLVFASYLQRDFMFDLASRVWSCL